MKLSVQKNTKSSGLKNSFRFVGLLVLLFSLISLTSCSRDDDPADNDFFAGTYNGSISYNLEYFTDIKPILKPFYDYADVLEITDEMNDYEIQMIEDNPDLIKRLPYDVIEKMFKNHIDVFGLINFGLAVSTHDVV